MVLLGPSAADASSVVGPDGAISGCYAKKGKLKGTLRVVAPRARCRKGERRVSWNAQGQAGQTGGQGGSGAVSTSTEARISQLETQVSQLQSQLSQLQSILSGITNTDLLNAIGSVGAVNSLCTEVPAVVNQANSLRTVIGGLSLTSGLLALGSLVIPSLPSALPAYACP
jgi:hypothetical protein